MIGEIDGVKIIATPEQYKNSKNSLEEQLEEKDKEIERLKNELEVSKNNEETYRLEMLDITKRLGLDEEALFDDVKNKAERLNNIINELEKDFERKIQSCTIEAETTTNDFYCRLHISALKRWLNKIQELKGEK